MHMCVFIHFKTANKKHRCAYLSTVSEGRTGLCCPLQWAGPPPRYRRPRTGRCQRHSCSAPKRRCRCSCCCCCPPSLWWSCGRRHRCASKPEESCWPSCRAGRPTDSRHLGEREREEVMWELWTYHLRGYQMFVDVYCVMQRRHFRYSHMVFCVFYAESLRYEYY